VVSRVPPVPRPSTTGVASTKPEPVEARPIEAERPDDATTVPAPAVVPNDASPAVAATSALESVPPSARSAPPNAEEAPPLLAFAKSSSALSFDWGTDEAPGRKASSRPPAARPQARMEEAASEVERRAGTSERPETGHARPRSAVEEAWTNGESG